MLLSSSPFTSAMRLLLCSSVLSFALIFGASNASQQPPSTQQQPCVHDHFSALLSLKQGFDPETRKTTLSSWNASNRDCCSWRGVTCEASTGHVIGLNLEDCGISGRVHWSSLLRLRSLQQLNLGGGNFFHPSPFPSGLDQLVNLTHLDLSSEGSSYFYGQIPPDISRLTNLVSLDLSSRGRGPFLGSSKFLALVQNLSSLEELRLDSIVVSTQGDEWGEVFSSALPNLRNLSMADCNLSGPILLSLSRLRYLSELDLSDNDLYTVVPTFIANVSSLTKLSLSFCGLYGEFPASIFTLPRLTDVQIQLNPYLTGYFPEFPQNSSLQLLRLSLTGFHGEVPHSLGNLKELVYISAGSCNLSGSLPSSLANLTRLKFLYLSYNNLSGPLPFSDKNELWKLTEFDVSYNLLSGAVPSLFFSLPSLEVLHLEYNQFDGFNSELQNVSFSPLTVLRLEHNNFQGHIPRFIFRLQRLWELDLSMNNFSGVVDLSFFSQQKNLEHISLSNNGWSVHDSSSSSTLTSFPQIKYWGLRSCNITGFPDVLREVSTGIEHLDLSDNEISGEIPQWIWALGRITHSNLNLSRNELEGFSQPFSDISLSSWGFLDLSFNKIEGSMMVPSQYTLLYSLANNFLSGEVSSLICNLTSLAVLDLSHNRFNGSIPPCLGEISNSVDVLNLQGNAFHGTLNLTFQEGCTLRTLDVSGNYLQGQVPTSMANCRRLELLNLGDNQIHDTFPIWSQILPSLHVLVLRSNKFYGDIGLNINVQTFPQLQVFDISSNDFTGSLPSNIFKSWKRMIEDTESLSTLSRDIEVENGTSQSRIHVVVGTVYYQDTVTVVLKGTELEMEKILTAFTLIDVSNNKFHGSIPKSVGDLRALLSLNMSYNNFTGQIPASLENLRFLETLDLSQNSLSGEIPPQLTKLNFLAVLNLSHNLLVGAIPQGQQFSAFSNDSFLWNMGLCGGPLTKKCGVPNILPPMTKQSQGISKFDWAFLGSGFAVGNGVGVGLFFWTLALWTKGRRQFILLIDKVMLFIFPSGVFSPNRHH